MNLNPINFLSGRNQHCCGVFDIGHFGQRQLNTYRGETKYKFASNAEVFADFESRLAATIRDDYRIDDTERSDHILLTATLVSSTYNGHSTGQMPEFVEYLLGSGWSQVQRFVNANTGNTVTLYHRLVTPDEMGFDFEKSEDEEW